MTCRVVEAWTHADQPARLWSCDRPWDWAALLVQLAQHDERELAVRMLAAAFRDVPRFDQPAAVQAWTQRAIRYEPDTAPKHMPARLARPPRAAFERFSAPGRTLAKGAGDCDDSARLVRAVLRALGWPARLTFLGTRDVPWHVCATLPGKPRPFWLDASLPALPGEHPTAAMRRTGWKPPSQ